MNSYNKKEEKYIKIKKYKIFIFVLTFLLILKINYFGSKKTTQKLVLHIGKNCIHIHHWFSLLILIFFMHFIRKCKYIYFETLIIIFSACIFEGLLFKDLLQFKINCVNI